MASVLYNCILVLLEREGSTLRDLITFMELGKENHVSEKNRALVRFAQKLDHHEGLPEYFTTRFRTVPDITKRAITSRLDGLVTGTAFGEITCRESTINLEELIDLKKVILFNFSKGVSADEGATLGRLVISMIQGIALRRELNRYHVPIHMIVDEVHNYVGPSLETVLRETRKYELYLTAIQTTLGDGMSQTLAKLMKQQTMVKIMGQVDRDAYREAVSFVGCEVEEISRLPAYEFFMSVLSRPPVRFKSRIDLLGKRYAMSDSAWKVQLALYQERYYRLRKPAKQPEPDHSGKATEMVVDKTTPQASPPQPPPSSPDLDDDIDDRATSR
jgi:hypothetical protein